MTPLPTCCNCFQFFKPLSRRNNRLCNIEACCYYNDYFREDKWCSPCIEQFREDHFKDEHVSVELV